MQRQRSGPPGKGTDARRDSLNVFHDVLELSGQDTLIGKVIHERYTIIARIGSGGMARIYLAEDAVMRERVAVKIMSESTKGGDDRAERFFREARAAARIDHPNIIAIKNIGTYGSNIFCVMEYLEGFDLSTLLVNSEGIPWPRAAGILSQVCDALEAAHQAGIIHRDIKPENVMIVPDEAGERIKVLDFGLARMMDGSDKLTKDELVLGTLTYISPEQAWGGREVDSRSDIYALGAMAYEMACGTPPFMSGEEEDRARTLQILTQHRDRVPDPLRSRKPDIEIPPEAESAIMRALMKNPDDRFASARQMKEAMLGLPLHSPSMPPAVNNQDQAGKSSGALVGHPWQEAEAAHQDERHEDYVYGHGHRHGARRPGSFVLPEVEDTVGRFLKRGIRRAIALCAVAGAVALSVMYFRGDLDRAYESVRSRAAPASAAPQEESGRARAQEQGLAQGAYHALISSTPTGAAVSEAAGSDGKGRLLGRTPLDTAFVNYENALLVTKPGYVPARVIVTRAQPVQNVTLKPLAKQAAPEKAGGNEGNVKADGDGENSTTPPAAAAEPENTGAQQ
jgi:serine/threonine protein kinase